MISTSIAKPQTLKINKEIQNLLPPLGHSEFHGLETDIVKNGCLSPFVVWDDVIVDGHHRYLICQKHNIPFETRTLEFASLDEAKFWVWQHQANRRNCTIFQRVEIALQFKPMLAAKAKEKEKVRKSAHKNSTSTTLSKSPRDMSTRAELARITGVSEGTISKVEYLLEYADERVKDQLRYGFSTINHEYNRLKKSHERELVFDCSKLPLVAKKVKPESVGKPEPDQSHEQTDIKTVPRLRVAGENEVPDFDPEPMTPTYPNPMDTFKESVTLQHILVHDTESLVTCLFSIFDAKYRKQLILDVLKKFHTEEGLEYLEKIMLPSIARQCRN